MNTTVEANRHRGNNEEEEEHLVWAADPLRLVGDQSLPVQEEKYQGLKLSLN